MKKKSMDNLPPHLRLEKMLSTPSPRHWLMILALLVFLAGAGVWGVYGLIPTTVKGKGILVRQEAVFDVISLGSGQVIELLVHLDDMVEENQVVGRIRQADLVNTIAKMESHLKLLRTEEKMVAEYGRQRQQKETGFTKQRRRSLRKSIALGEERLTQLAERIKSYKRMMDRGVVSRSTYLDAKKEHADTMKQIMGYRDELAALEAQDVGSISTKERENIDIKLEVLKVSKELDALRARLESTSRIVSPKAGRVVEIFKDQGGMLNQGDPLIRLEVSSPDKDLKVVAYFSPYQGKMIKPGMAINLSPSTVRMEEFGFMEGRVEYVSLFPATRPGMIHVLGNEALVRDLSTGGAPIMVKASLDKDPNSVSGYKWSTGEGPPLKLQSGTLCDLQAVIRKDPPLYVAFPRLRRLVRDLTARLGE